MQAQNVQVVASERARRKMVEVNQPGAPNVTLDDTVRLYLGGKRVEVHHFGRAHTDGDVVAYFPDHRAVAMGDMFTVGDGLPPLVDYPGGGSTREWPRSLEGALALDFETAIPGHGKPATKEDLRKYRDNLTMLGRRVHEMLTKNAPRAEVEKELRSRFGFQDFHIQLSLDGLLAELR
jgi:glyoxylase-like metal-dependent hydrolase (beta-lactamase superfamily II)